MTAHDPLSVAAWVVLGLAVVFFAALLDRAL